MNSRFKNELKKVIDSYTVGFHVPGHNRGKLFKTLGYSSAKDLTLDTTEIPGTDNLHQAEGLIQASQERARAFYGSLETHFLVNGSTCGNYAMLMTACKPGETMIVGRDSHRSVYNGLMLGQIKPVFLYPEIRAKDHLPLGYNPEALDELLQAHPEAKAVHITRPNYYGVCSDIEAISQICRRHDVLLLVDEAHGAHLKLHELLPESAVEQGADLVVQSTHKTLPSMTQSSMLHRCSDRVDVKRLKFMLQIHQSSSPSYVLLEALDQAVEIASQHGRKRMSELMSAIEGWQGALASVKGIQTVGAEVDGYTRDITKLLVSLMPNGIYGSQLEDRLRADYGIQLEMSTHCYGVGIATIGNEAKDFEALTQALVEMAAKDVSAPIEAKELPDYPKAGKRAYDMNESFNRASQEVSLDEAVGEVSHGFIIPYPPGIPLVVPGEVISAELIAYIKELKQLNHTILGMSGSQGTQIEVVI